MVAFVLVFASTAFAAQNVVLVGAPYIRTEGNVIVADITVKNIGTDMVGTWIIEMQPVPPGQQPAAVTGQEFYSTCSVGTPQNVHVRYSLLAGQQKTFQLRSSPGTGTWDVHLFSRSQCANEGLGFMAVQPWAFFGPNKINTVVVSGQAPFCTPNWQCSAWGACQSNGVQDRQCTDSNNCGVSSGRPEIARSCSPTSTTLPSGGGSSAVVAEQFSINVDGDKVVATVKLRNAGAAMSEPNILEMQVRPAGAVPLTAAPGQEAVCDPAYPNNRHEAYQLGAGETRSIEISVDNVQQGTYDVWLHTRRKCSSELAAGENNLVDPWKGSVVARGVKVGAAGGVNAFAILGVLFVGIGLVLFMSKQGTLGAILAVLGFLGIAYGLLYIGTAEGSGGAEKSFLVTCSATFKDFVGQGPKVESISCSRVRECGIADSVTGGVSVQSDNGEAGYLDYQSGDRSVRQPVSFGITFPEQRKSYSTSFCSKATSGSATHFSTTLGAMQHAWAVV